MTNAASLSALQNKLVTIGGSMTLTGPERAFLRMLVDEHCHALRANELYLTPAPAEPDVLHDGEVPTYPEPRTLFPK